MRPIERLKEDLMNDAREATKPVTSAQIANIHRMIDIVARTAESCDLDLAKHVTTQGHQIKALEEAICPRVAARLQSLEHARSCQSAENRLVYDKLKELEAKLQPVTPAPAASPPGFMINGIGYTMEEGRVASIIAGGVARNKEDFNKAREIVDLLRGS